MKAIADESLDPEGAANMVNRALVATEGYVDDSDLNRRTMMIGGDKCDHCSKTSVDLGAMNFNACRSCQRAYYCSPECQRAAWKAGHKQACCKPDERYVGDLMHLRSLQKRTKINERLVEMVEAVGGDRWLVRFYCVRDGEHPGGNNLGGQKQDRPYPPFQVAVIVKYL